MFPYHMALAAMVVALSACSTGHDEGTAAGETTAAATTLAFDCPDRYRFTARITADNAKLLLPDSKLTLPRARSGSGARYGKDGVTFWNKGEEAMLETASGTRRGCRINRPRSIREDARLRGVDFRGVGNEPGWHVEITTAGNTLVVLDYGARRLVFATPSPITDPGTQTTTYSAKAGDQDMVIRIIAQPCRDTMSDAGYTHAVTVLLGDREYRGCGHTLQR